MSSHDDENLLLLGSIDEVDSLNARFYDRFPFPWRPMKFDVLDDPDFERVQLNQDLGDWHHRTVPPRPEIWVAGCGTNQAAITALRFPRARVLGSDVSEKALELCSKTVDDLGLENLELVRESINTVDYHERFDVVICTGVIHHNARPELTLERLAAALKPGGVLELMVSNRYARAPHSALQKVIRGLAGTRGEPDFERELEIARGLRDHLPAQNSLAELLERSRDWSEELFADTVLQPIDRSYSVESLSELAASCGLELLTPCINQYDRTAGGIVWNLDFSDAELQRRYDALDDLERWQLSELLLFESGPVLLWFYLGKKDPERPRRGEKEICETFLDTVFERAETEQRSFVRTDDGGYRRTPPEAAIAHPPKHHDDRARRVLESVDGRTPMRRLVEKLGIELDFHTANDLRIHLASSAYPYLRSVVESRSRKPGQKPAKAARDFKKRRRKMLEKMKSRGD